MDYVVGAWTNACVAAQLEDLHIHDVRHEALSRLAETGKFTLPELQLFSGHRDLRMLMRYAHLCASRLAGKLDESFKDSSKIRIHRGRRFLNKAASIDLAALSNASSAPAASAAHPGEGAARSDTDPPAVASRASNVVPFPARKRA